MQKHMFGNHSNRENCFKYTFIFWIIEENEKIDKFMYVVKFMFFLITVQTFGCKTILF